FAGLPPALKCDNCVFPLTAQMYVSHTINRALLSLAFNGNAVVVGVVSFGYRNLPLVQACQWSWADMNSNSIFFFVQCLYSFYSRNSTLEYLLIPQITPDLFRRPLKRISSFDIHL